MSKRFFGAMCAVFLLNTVPVFANGNPWATSYCEQHSNANCLRVPAGESWSQLFPDEAERHLAQAVNRQSKMLMAGQDLVVPQSGADLSTYSPFPLVDRLLAGKSPDVFLFDPRLLAWAHYQVGILQRWGPAVGGKSWCSDKNRGRGAPCQTTVGEHFFTEAAGVNRRSSAYPAGCVAKCARMPYFVRFTAGGQGLHQRVFAGANASHGCVGVLRSDILYINDYVRSIAMMTRYGYLNQTEISRVGEQITFIVLPYD